MSAEPVTVYFDGLCEPARPGGPRNPGGLGCGGWYIPAHPGIGPHEIAGGLAYGAGPEMTNNVAEYNAALDALRALYRTGYRGAVLLLGDSKLVVNQTLGLWSCNVPKLQDRRQHLRDAFTHFSAVEIRWVPRTANERADAESRRAYNAARVAAAIPVHEERMSV